MFYRVLYASAAILGASQVAYGQTSTQCNPLSQSCPADPAVGGTITIDFTKGANDFFTLAEGTELTYDPNMGAVFTMSSPSDAPTITSTKYIFFGRVDVTVQVAPGTGIVSSSVLQSDDLDEIDLEWLGGDPTQVQTNYYSKGNTTTYDRGGFSPVTDCTTEFHTYTVDWTAEALTWSIDGLAVRTLTYASSPDTYPQTPMQLKLGLWDGGGPNEPMGTVQWAGGYTPLADFPFKAYYKTITIQDYSNGVSGATSYVYGDESGTYQSIKVQTDGGSESSSGSSSSSAAPSSTSSSATQSSTPSSSSSSSASSSTQTTMSVSMTSTSGGAATTASGTAAGSATTSASAGTPSAPASSAGIKSAVNFVLIGASLVLGYLVL